jgi:AraC-like DNA-binding protein/quercetin dioxygenase-like cupin family protein
MLVPAVRNSSQIQVHSLAESELTRLTEVNETCQPLREMHPIWVRQTAITGGPSIPHPERHPYCEIGFTCKGRGAFFVEHEQAGFQPGDMLFVGTGVPHWGVITEFPYVAVIVYFLPSVLIDLGPEGDGPRILRRLTASQSLKNRMIRPPPQLKRHAKRLFCEIAGEFATTQFGREIRLRTLLMELLVLVLRWEAQQGTAIDRFQNGVDWKPILKALDFLREHYTGPVYAHQVAQAAGLSESRLKTLFQQALGMSWVKYLQGYRVHRAAALLGQPGSNVTEAAFAVGFESLSHFNTIFRSFMGVPPTIYARNARREGPQSPAMDSLIL